MSELERLNECADQVSVLNDQIDELEHELKALKAHRKNLSDKIMLDLMLDCGVESITRNNVEFSIKEYVSGSIPNDIHDKQRAFAWLEEHGVGELIKNVVSVQFPKGDNDRASDAIELLRDLGCSPQREQSVHPMTLKKFARERLEDGLPINLDILGLYAGQTVKFKKVKGG